MYVIFEIGNEDCLLKVTQTKKGLSVTCGTSTLGWGVQGKSTLEKTLKDQEKSISRQLKNLDKTNRASKKGLEFLLNELTKNRQLKLL